jgi:hypothetical protein
MSAYYTYLISSLPLLSFANRAPFNLEDFFIKCKDLIPEKEFKILRDTCTLENDILDTTFSLSLAKWVDFEFTLRNELVRARAARKKVDALKYLRLPDSPQAEISHLAMTAYRTTSILEAEKILDQGRWNFLENLSLKHYFDFDALLIYGLKLKILQRWEKLQKVDKELLISAVI